MKHIAIALTAFAVAASAYAQGVVNFSTRAGASVNAPVTYLGDNTLADGRFWGQLYVAAPNGTLAPSGSPTAFRSDAGKGYITAGGNVEVPGVTPGSSAQVKLVAWAGTINGVTVTSYAQALALGQGGVGESGVITINTGGGTLPPAALAGLQGFNISPIIPEPSIAALGLLGAGLLLIRRKK